ncbi:HET domain-containing protein [Fusarium falciforme]|uniref:HET domain-containing protein n=1 Tax=Fusarium falciforme TaxID=195108 RepID=UPI002301AE40|nr:HET domain-containing protein [Fusarium falciforme]WAO82883.1 HET domain-containing protein [Fusarium falciforme]
MKLFRKLKGKKEGKKEGHVGTSETQQPRSQTPSTPQAQNRNEERRSTAPGGLGSLRVTSSVAPNLQELMKLMASPASSMSAEEARNMVELQSPGPCPICCNLDPYRAPPDVDTSETHRSWARAEYNIPAETPVSKITVEKSEDLVESSQRGCLYCTMIRTALGTANPTWETEKSYMYIYLASGLPVIVHLAFGGTSTVRMGREEMLNSFGVELPEGQAMNFIITVDDFSKPPIDVEIYRSVLNSSETTVGDVVVAPLVEYMGAASPIPEHSGDPRCFEFINKQVTNCMKNHKCGGDGPLPLLPDRIIWIEANNSTRIQLMEPRDIRAKYIAVSYCWGPTSPDTYLTNASTLEAKKAGIRFQDLPPLFQDVVSCSRSLGIEYVWIDRLCIIQGQDEDFKRQAAKMHQIYGNATLTIAAASAASENDRILVPRDMKGQAFNLNLNIDGIGSLKLGARRRTHTLGTEDKGGDYGKISTRAWIWQERLLSGRMIFYTPSALKFECNQHSIWEGFAPDVTGHSWSAQLNNISHTSWTSLVEEYMSRDITRQSDRLPAMDSVMKRISQSQGWSPLWGMWANMLVESLGWQSKVSEKSGKLMCRTNPGNYAPSWSWASVDGPISYVSARGLGGLEANDPMIYDVEIRSVNAASGLIRVAGHAISVELSCRVEIYEPGDGNPTREREVKHHYEVLRVYNNGQPFPMHPDVHLRPGNINVTGQNVRTVVRLPHSEKPPETSWTANCLCLLVGNMRLRAQVLFLGGSLRQDRAWERIGMVDGLHPAIFGTSERRLIDIV